MISDSTFMLRPLFSRLDPRCFDLYVEHGLKDIGDGSGRVTLTIPKKVERDIFQWVRLDSPNASECAVEGMYMYSDEYTTTSKLCIWNNSQYFRNMKFHKYHGGHLFPLQAPEDVASVIADYIAAEVNGKQA
eukprot:comp16499_c0_seq1/m.26456 comp16499_c0_seq1/g.26456  ORF comp16499_c0_seq1/g.26456 comp16499_c0_seq1/m.26456 type:complete len:132 (+) comp16499_c0_seq1:626-1021(+)